MGSAKTKEVRPSRGRPSRWLLRAIGLPAAFLGGALLSVVGIRLSAEPVQPIADPSWPSSYYELLAMPPAQLAKVDIAVANLLCAHGLPGAESIDIPAALATLDKWADRVRFETERHLYRVNDPRYADHYKHSEARLRAEFLLMVLHEDCGVHYNMERVREVNFAKSQDMFIHGMIANTNGGTCASLPVLYAAVGRRLGYPIKLVLAREHVFCRWDDGKERFNIDGGVDEHPDDYYRTWPLPLSEKMLASGEFLKSLSTTEELSAFLFNRGTCLHANRRVPEAIAAYAQAHRLCSDAFTPRMSLEMAVAGVPFRTGPAQASDPRLQRASPLAPGVQAGMPPDPTPPMPMPGNSKRPGDRP